MNISVTHQDNGTVKVTPDHPSHPEHIYGTVYAALDAAKALHRCYPALYDTITLSEVLVYVG